MDGSSGTYGNGFPGGYPRNSSATGDDRFKANVNRSKTRKWVEAKPQNYDGDDWGADYGEDEEEQEAESHADPEPTARPLGSRQFEQPLAAADLSVNQPGSSSHNVRGHPALRIQNQQLAPSSCGESGGDSTTAPPEGPGSRQDIHASWTLVPGPQSTAGASDAHSSYQAHGGSPQSANFPLRKSSLESAELPRHSTLSGDNIWPEPRLATQASVESSGKTLPIIRPADIYKKMSVEVDRERRSVDSGPMAERKSEYGLDGLLSSYGDEDDADQPGEPALPTKPHKDLTGEPLKEADTRTKIPVALPSLSVEPHTARESAEARPMTPVLTPVVLDTLKGSPESATRPSSPGGSGLVHNLVQAINSRSASPVRLSQASPSTPQQETNDPQATVDPSPSTAPTTETFGIAGHGEVANRRIGENENDGFTTRPSTTDNDPVEEGHNEGIKEPMGMHALSKTAMPMMLRPSDEAHSVEPLKTGSPLQLAVSVSRSRAGQETATLMTPSTSRRSALDSRLVPISASSEEGEIIPTAPLNTRKGVAASETKDEPVAPPLSERPSIIDTATGSVLKENDMLGDEIIKSMSPVHASPKLAGVQTRERSVDHAPAGSPVRESSYLPDLYDDYWSSEVRAEQGAHGHDQGSVQEGSLRMPEVPTILGGSREQKPVAVSQLRLSEASGSCNLSRRFSWQDDHEQINIPEHDDGVVETIRADSGIFGPTPFVQAQTGATHSPNGLPATTEGDAGTISHQESRTSLAPAVGPREAPAPISRLPNKTAPSLLEAASLPRPQEAGRSSLVPPSAGTKARAPSPPDSERTTTRTPTSDTPILSFKDIMTFSTSDDRRRAFNDTRMHIGGSDTGLIDWVVAMQTQHAEYANMSSSFASAAALGGSPPGAQGLGYSMQGGGPHFPQHMLQSHLHHLHGVNFQHTSQQVGTKSKELLMAAGKAGKGLLSKGKNKLRGTGERVFS